MMGKDRADRYCSFMYEQCRGRIFLTDLAKRNILRGKYPDGTMPIHLAVEVSSIEGDKVELTIQLTEEGTHDVLGKLSPIVLDAGDQMIMEGVEPLDWPIELV